MTNSKCKIIEKKTWCAPNAQLLKLELVKLTVTHTETSILISNVGTAAQLRYGFVTETHTTVILVMIL